MGINLRKAGMTLAIEILAHSKRMRALGSWQYHFQGI